MYNLPNLISNIACVGVERRLLDCPIMGMYDCNMIVEISVNNGNNFLHYHPANYIPQSISIKIIIIYLQILAYVKMVRSCKRMKYCNFVLMVNGEHYVPGCGDQHKRW